MAEPTYEELKARLAELEKQPRRTGSLEFRVSEKGGSAYTDWDAFPSRSTTNSGTDCSRYPTSCASFWKKTSRS